MPNDSSTGGYLLPGFTPAAPSTDLALDGIFQALIANVTGLPGNLVRPRYQQTPPQEPCTTDTWAGVGVISIRPDDGPRITHSESGDTVNRHEIIEVLASFYGPAGQQYATMARDGIGLPQNMEALNALNIGLTEFGPLRSVPELINQQWRRRYDFSITFRRQVLRTYPILDIASSQSVITTDSPLFSETVNVVDN
jgi:hypothetical protein